MEQTSLPFGVPTKRYPTMHMITCLKRHKKYKKDMEYEEAAAIIRGFAESYEPPARRMPSVALAMAQFLKEKKQMEEKNRHIRKML